MDKQKHKKLIDEFAENCPCKEECCSLRELALNLFQDPRTLVQGKCIEKFKTAFMFQADHFYGASGRTSLETNGDRAFGNFDFWAIIPSDPDFEWVRTATYNTATGRLIRYPQP